MKKIILVVFVFCFLPVYHLSAQALKPAEAESSVTFVIRNMGMDVDGSLRGLKGVINFDPTQAAKGSFDVTADVNTINTGIEKRDNHLKQSDFFDAETYPVIQIKSTRILPKTGNIYYAEAMLTMHGVTKDIKFDFIAKPVAGGYLFTANFSLNRLDYKIGKNSMTMGDKVNVKLSVVGKK